jgi:ribosomal protein S18 acetylase RimI-like enzyme
MAMPIVRKPDTISEPNIRPAIAGDVAAITRIVDDAYRHYIPRMGRTPAPMLDNYAARVSEGVVWVIEEGNTVRGVSVLLPNPDHLLLENIAVDPAYHGTGLGRRLLVFAEAEAMRQGYRELRLYTHETMIENQRLYAKIGYEETGRRTEVGFERVFLRKRLSGISTNVLLPLQK